MTTRAFIELVRGLHFQMRSQNNQVYVYSEQYMNLIVQKMECIEDELEYHWVLETKIRFFWKGMKANYIP
jgi:hypothetical protein